MKWFLELHLRNPIASPVIIERICHRFRRDVKTFAVANQVPVLALKEPDRSRRDDRKLDHVRPICSALNGMAGFGVVATVTAQEFRWVFSATKRISAGGEPALRFGNPRAMTLTGALAVCVQDRSKRIPRTNSYTLTPTASRPLSSTPRSTTGSYDHSSPPATDRPHRSTFAAPSPPSTRGIDDYTDHARLRPAA